MGFIIFIVGFVIFSTYVFFFMFSTKKEIDSMPTLKDDMIDYDGHGNWGRFPPKKTNIKEGRVKTNAKPPRKTKKPNIGFMGQKP